MADSQPQGRNSEGVTTVRHPRTDFPQDGWILASVFGPENFTAISAPARAFLAQSFRSPRRQVAAAEKFELTDFPQRGWMPQFDALYGAEDYAAISQLVECFRNVRNRSLYLDGERKPISSDLGEGPPPAEFGWFTHEETIRAFAQRLRLAATHQAQPSDTWMAFVSSGFDDPTTQSGWQSLTRSFRTETALRYLRDTNSDISWIQPEEQDIQGLPGIAQLADSFRNVRNRSLYQDGERHPIQGGGGSSSTVPTYDPAENSWPIDSQRVPASPYWTSAGPSVDWITIPSTVFDPATVSWTMDSTYPRSARPKQMSWTKSGYFIHLFYNPAHAGWVIDSQRVPGGPYWSSPGPTTDWIPPELVAVFNPAQQHWGIPHQRVPGKPYWTAPWQGTDWLNPALLEEIAHDPRNADWTIQSNTYQSRAWYIDSPQQQAWMVPAVIFDATLGPATAIPSHRIWNKAIGRWQPDVDNAWLTENPVVPVTFTAAFATQANKLSDAGGSPVEGH